MGKIKFLLIFTISIISLGVDAQSMFDDIKILAKQTSREVKISITSLKFKEFSEIFIDRSTSPIDNFRQIKYINKEKIKTAYSTNEFTIVDDHPLGQQINSFYRVRVAINDSVMKVFPPIKVDSYNDNTVKFKKAIEEKNTIGGEATIQFVNIEEDERIEEIAKKSGIENDKLNAKILENTKVLIEKDNQNNNIVYIQSDYSNELNVIYIQLNNNTDGSFFTLKEVNQQEISTEFIDGKYKYKMSLEEIKGNTSKYNIKLKMITNSDSEIETKTVGF